MVVASVAQGAISAAAAEEAAARAASAPAGEGTGTKQSEILDGTASSAAQFLFASLETVFFSCNVVICI
jgi:hypothetical protein